MQYNTHVTCISTLRHFVGQSKRQKCTIECHIRVASTWRGLSTQPILEKVVLMVLNELGDEPHNEFLRLFASRQHLRKQTIMKQEMTDVG